MCNYSQDVLVMEESDLDSKEIRNCHHHHTAGATHPAQLAVLAGAHCSVLQGPKRNNSLLLHCPGATVGSALPPAHSHGPDPASGTALPAPTLAGLVSRLPFLSFSPFVTRFFQWSCVHLSSVQQPLPTVTPRLLASCSLCECPCHQRGVGTRRAVASLV